MTKKHVYKGHASQFRRDEGKKPGHSSYDHHQLAQPHNANFQARAFHEEKGQYTDPAKIHLSKVSHTRHDIDGERFQMNGAKSNPVINCGTENAARPDNWHSMSSTSSEGSELVQHTGSAYHGSKGLGAGTEFRGSRGYSGK